MMIGLLTVELFLPAVNSLKSKRSIIKSIKTRIQNKFNVSIAEIDKHDKWQRCVLGIVMISTDQKIIHRIFSKIITIVEDTNEIELLSFNTQIL